MQHLPYYSKWPSENSNNEKEMEAVLKDCCKTERTDSSLSPKQKVAALI